MLNALVSGIGVGLARPWLALPLYLVSLVLSLLPVAIIALGVSALAGDRPWAGDLAGPNWLNLLLELVPPADSAGLGGGALDRVAAASSSIGLAFAAAGLAFLLQGALYNLFAGGVLERLNHGATFWAGCFRWFWPFVRLGIVGMLVLMVLVPLGGIGLVVLATIAGPIFAVVVGFVAVAVVNGWLELARASMVARADGRAFRALGYAARIALEPAALPVFLVAWLALAAIGVALLAVQPGAIDLIDPTNANGLVVGVLAGQALHAAGAWLKVVRLSVALSLSRQ